MQEKGLAPGVGDVEARKNAAVAAIDNMLAVYDDDEEAWSYRAQLACGGRDFGGDAASVPFYKALVRLTVGQASRLPQCRRDARTTRSGNGPQDGLPDGA